MKAVQKSPPFLMPHSLTLDRDRDPDSRSDRTPRKKYSSSKKQRILQMKDKMKIIMAKVQQLEKQKKQDREQLTKLLGSGDHLEKLAVGGVHNIDMIRSASLRKIVRKDPDEAILTLSQRKGMSKSVSVADLKMDKSYVRATPLTFKQVKKDKIKLRHETVKNFTIAVFLGIALILFIKFLPTPHTFY